MLQHCDPLLATAGAHTAMHAYVLTSHCGTPQGNQIWEQPAGLPAYTSKPQPTMHRHLLGRHRLLCRRINPNNTLSLHVCLQHDLQWQNHVD